MFRIGRILICSVLGLVVGYFWLKCALERDPTRGTSVLNWTRAGVMCFGHDGVIRCDRVWCRECGWSHGSHKERCPVLTRPSARTQSRERIVHTLGRTYWMWEVREGTTVATVGAPFWVPFVLFGLYPADAAWLALTAHRRRKRTPDASSENFSATQGTGELSGSATTAAANMDEGPSRPRSRLAGLARKYTIALLTVAAAQMSYDWITHSAWVSDSPDPLHRNILCVLPLIIDASTMWKLPAVRQKGTPMVPTVIVLPFWMVIAGLAAYPSAALICGPCRRWRRRRRGLCVCCGYDLTGNASGRCPECGSAA